jgi:hypothetical protein
MSQENFSYFTNRDHFGLQDAIKQIRAEQSRPPPPGFYQVPQPPPGFYQQSQQVFYQQPPYQLYNLFPLPQQPQQVPLIERRNQQIAPLQTTDLNIQAAPWTTSDESFFDFEDCHDEPLENKSPQKSQKKRGGKKHYTILTKK